MRLHHGEKEDLYLHQYLLEIKEWLLHHLTLVEE
jgi:hypothetical protein